MSLLAVLGGAVALVAATARICFDESLYTTPGHFAYYACVSSVIRNAPRVMPVGELTFYSSAGDGPKPSEDELAYLSSAGSAEIVSKTEDYFRSRGFSLLASAGAPSSVLMRGTESSVSISVEPSGTDTVQVKVSQKFD